MGIWQTEAILYTRHNTEKIDCQWSTPNQEIEQCKKKNVHISIEQICESEAVKGELGYNTLYLTTALLALVTQSPLCLIVIPFVHCLHGSTQTLSHNWGFTSFHYDLMRTKRGFFPNVYKFCR